MAEYGSIRSNSSKRFEPLKRLERLEPPLLAGAPLNHRTVFISTAESELNTTSDRVVSFRRGQPVEHPVHDHPGDGNIQPNGKRPTGNAAMPDKILL